MNLSKLPLLGLAFLAFNTLSADTATAGPSFSTAPAPGCPTVCDLPLVGDINQSGSIEIGDMIWLVDYLFNGQHPDTCAALADVNGDYQVDLADWVYLKDYLFFRGPAPVQDARVPGDANMDGSVDIADFSVLFTYLFGDDDSGVEVCPETADANGDCSNNIADISYLSNYLYNGGDEPVLPADCH